MHGCRAVTELRPVQLTDWPVDDTRSSKTGSALVASLARLFIEGDGRFAASLFLLVMLTLGLYSDDRDEIQQSDSTLLTQVVDIAAKPFMVGRRFLFDGYQRAFPRKRSSYPVTIVGIDERSLTTIGQWPWPRNRMAQLVEAIGSYQPAAIAPRANMTCCTRLREISEQRGSYVQDPSTKGFHARSAVFTRFRRIARSP